MHTGLCPPHSGGACRKFFGLFNNDSLPPIILVAFVDELAGWSGREFIGQPQGAERGSGAWLIYFVVDVLGLVLQDAVHVLPQPSKSCTQESVCQLCNVLHS